MEKKTIYKYIIENLDAEDENYIPETLIDEPSPTVPHPLGAEEAYWQAMHAKPYTKGAEEIYKLLLGYLRVPEQTQKRKLYEALSALPIISITEPLCKALEKVKQREQLYALARSFFYNSFHRGPVKFAFIVFGLYGMDRIEKEDSALWEDLIKVACCEEFTYFFNFACEESKYVPNKVMWRFIGCTSGWGKVSAIEHACCTDDAQSLWLIQNGMDINVDFPPLAVQIMKKTNLSYYLSQDAIDERTFEGAMVLLNAFLLVIDNSGDGYFEEEINTGKFNPVKLIRDILRHAKAYADIPEKLLQVVNLRLSLENILDNRMLVVIDENEGQLLLAECDRLIYNKDWQSYIDNNIIKDDAVNYELCDFACELDMDIWKPLFDFFCEHPYEYKLMAYLFSYNEFQYQEMALHAVEYNLDKYQMEEHALLVPLRYLVHNPGVGEKIIIAALTAMYDWPRGIACSVLNEWGLEFITEPIRNALWEARALSNNPVVTERIDALLTGKEYTDEEIADSVINNA